MVDSRNAATQSIDERLQCCSIIVPYRRKSFAFVDACLSRQRSQLSLRTR